MKSLSKNKDFGVILLTIILGSLSHFFYEWVGYNAFAALISPVNESIWEHLKLLFFPFFVFTVFEYIIRKPAFESFFSSRYIGVMCGMLAIIVLFYGYSRIIGTHILVLDILIFIIAVLVSYKVSRYLYKNQIYVDNPLLIFLAWFITILFFFIFTAYPPNIPLFFPPVE